MISYLKKTVSVMLVLIALLSCISIIPTAAVDTTTAEAGVNAEGENELAATEKSYEDFRYIVLDNDTIMITDYIGTSNDITVPDSIDDMDISKIADDAFDSVENVTLHGYADSVTCRYARKMGFKFEIIKFESIEIESFRATAIDEVTLKWEKVDEAKKYLVCYRRVDKNCDYSVKETKLETIEIELDEDETYYFYVIALDASNNEITEMPDMNYEYTCTTKVPITSLKNVSDGISVTWNEVSGAAYYRVYHKIEGTTSWKGVCDTKNTTFIDKSVASGEKYTYTVRALDKNKNHISWYDKKGTTLIRLEQPKIKSIENKGTSAKITYTTVSGAYLYKIYFRRSYNSTWRLLGTSKTGTITDDNLTSGITYYYTVEAVNRNTSYVSCKDTGSGGYKFFYLSVPKVTSAKATNKKGDIEINWNKVPGASKYVVYFKRTDLNNGWIRAGVTTSTSLTDSNCKEGKTYIYTVRCISSDGKRFESSFDPKAVTITYHYGNLYPELKDAVITSGNGKYAKAYITWGTVPGAYQYRLFYKRQAPDGTYSSSSWKRLATLRNTAYGDYYLKYGYKYIYTVRALDKNGNYCSSFDSKGISLLPTAEKVKKAMGYLVKSDSVDLRYSAYPIKLSDADRYYAECIVMGESGNMSREGMALVCQSLRDAYATGRYSSIASAIGSMGYVAPLKKPNKQVEDIVRYIFDEGGSAAEHRVLVFYACNCCSSAWHESQCFIYQVGSVRYFDMWNY